MALLRVRWLFVLDMYHVFRPFGFAHRNLDLHPECNGLEHNKNLSRKSNQQKTQNFGQVLESFDKDKLLTQLFWPIPLPESANGVEMLCNLSVVRRSCIE